ncbi:hypothetical protein MLD38_035325 [Melastoma candidum]|uniref:Uncharacterized protein n=1 Tax=Melastoma candidum TaxID=119954 RepID=A0ACB9LGK4_9MYRT|nr:hypothetical protein MLD38_035325 [Melastoma candidum]
MRDGGLDLTGSDGLNLTEGVMFDGKCREVVMGMCLSPAQDMAQPESKTSDQERAQLPVLPFCLKPLSKARQVSCHKQHVGYGMVRDFIAEFKEKKKEEERLSLEKEAEDRRKQRQKEQDSRRSGSKDRDRYREPRSGRDREREGDYHRDRSQNHESSRDRNGMGRRDGGRVDWRSRNGRDAARDRYRERSRSCSPVRHGYRRASRSPSRWSDKIPRQTAFFISQLSFENMQLPFMDTLLRVMIH